MVCPSGEQIAALMLPRAGVRPLTGHPLAAAPNTAPGLGRSVVRVAGMLLRNLGATYRCKHVDEHLGYALGVEPSQLCPFVYALMRLACDRFFPYAGGREA